MDGVEHGSCLTPTGIRQPDRLLEGLAARQTAVCPTLGWAPGVPPWRPHQPWSPMVQAGITLEAMRAAVRRAHHAGVRLVAGSDAGIAPLKPHGVLPETLVALVEADVPATEALAMATSGRLRPAGWETARVACGPAMTPTCCWWTATHWPISVRCAASPRSYCGARRPTWANEAPVRPDREVAGNHTWLPPTVGLSRSDMPSRSAG